MNYNNAIVPNESDSAGGTLLAEGESNEEAIARLELLLLDEPAYAVAHNDLGVLYFNMGDIDRSRACFQRAIECDSDNLAARKNLCDILILTRDFTNAANEIIPILVRDPDDAEYFGKYEDLKRLPGFRKTALMERFDWFQTTLPRTFTFETALACNLQCPECAIGADVITRRKGFVTFQKFKDVADKMRPFARYVNLHLWGEPLLNKEIFQIIKYTSDFAKVNISTNALLLDDAKAEQLIASGVTDLIVSMDGFTQEVYEQYRVGGKIQKVFEAIDLLKKHNAHYGNRVNIMPQFIVFKHNQHELQLFLDYCKEKQLIPITKSPYIHETDSQFERPDDSKFHRPEYENVSSLKHAMSDCVNPKEVFTMTLDGTVIICCHDFNTKTHFGNIFELDVLKIWNSPAYRTYRWDILSGSAPEYCLTDCMSWSLKKKNASAPAMSNNTSKKQINLCSGSILLKDYINIDIDERADIRLDLEKDLLSFESNSVDTVVCISAINYFTKERAASIIRDVYRVLKPGGVARFASQDLRVLTEAYVRRDESFYGQRLPDGSVRFPGRTHAEKFNNWFYGFPANGKACKYVYDFETLRLLFLDAGFTIVEQKKYLESEIPHIELIDNRPDQMFFLEAKKTPENGKASLKHIHDSDVYPQPLQQILTTVNAIRRRWKNGETEQAWQETLQLLDEHLEEKAVVNMAEEFLDDLQYGEEKKKLLEDYLGRVPNDIDAKQRLSLLRNSQLSSVQRSQQQSVIGAIHRYKGQVLDDAVHLKAAIDWMVRAFEQTRLKGVAATYYVREGYWHYAYPETTGYIIPTLLHYSVLTGDTQYRKHAQLMGDWEIDIQWRNGGVGEPAGVYGMKPRVFNTGQVMLGWLALFKVTGDSRYLDAATKAGHWISSLQERDGSWRENTYRGPKSYKVRVAWALAELYEITKEPELKNVAERAVAWTLAQANEHGWFDQTSLSEEGKPWTHLIGYTLVGLLECHAIASIDIDRDRIGTLLVNAAEKIAHYYFDQSRNPHRLYIGLPGTFDRSWSSNDQWSCLTGNAQVAYFYGKLGRMFQHHAAKQMETYLIDDVKRTHLLDPTLGSELYGALPGSHPLNGGYCTDTIPNWGNKFFADALLRRMTNSLELEYLS